MEIERILSLMQPARAVYLTVKTGIRDLKRLSRVQGLPREVDMRYRTLQHRHGAEQGDGL